MQDNPMFVDQIRNAVEKLREARPRPYDPVPEPMLHTWADQVAWERLRRESLAHSVWRWINSVENSDHNGLRLGDVEELSAILNAHHQPCPADLNTENEEN